MYRAFSFLILAFLASSAFAAKVCIDPGHGGGDAGAVGCGQYEKTNNLNTCLKFKAWLDKDTNDGSGGGSWAVYMTRSSDVEVSLSGRTTYANNVGADRFMSIHNNACGSCGATGTETYSYSATGTGADLRNKVQQRVLSAWGLTNRGNKTASFYVIRYTNMPAELAELGFIDTCSPDAARLGNATHQDSAALGHLYAIQTHLGYGAHTPVSFINPSYYFGGGVDGFTPGNSSSGIGWTGSDWSGSIYADQTGSDMFWYGPPTNYTGGYEESFNVQVYPQSGNSASHDMQLFYKTSGDNTWTASKSSQCAAYTAQNGWINVNLAVNSINYAAQNINQLRLDFDNTSKGTRFIVNHVLKQTTPRFWFDGGADGWVSGNSLTGLATQTGTSWGGIIYADQTGNDAFFYSSRFSFLGAANDFIYVRLYPQSGTAGPHDIKFYWSTASQDYMSESKSTPIQTYTGNNQWFDFIFEVGQLANWSGNFVTQLRMDVDATNHGNRWIIEKVYVHHH